MSRVRLDNAVVAQIVIAVWPDATAAGTQILGLDKDVRDVIDELPVPTVSRAQRDQILAEWEKIRG